MTYSASASDFPDDGSDRRGVKRPSLHRNLVIGAVLSVSGVFLGGFGLGWTAHSINGPPALPPVTVQVAAPSEGDGPSIPLPDVRGLLVADAEQAMIDAGLPPSAVTVVDAPSALPEDTVVRQDPVGGSEDVAAVTLYVSVPGVVPEVLGQPAETVRQSLFDLGVRVVERSLYQPGTPEGTVTSVEPAAGSALPDEVTITVSGPASSLFLSTLEPIESRCDEQETAVNGIDYQYAVVCSAGEQARSQVYLLDRLSTSLEGVAGITDESDPAYTAEVIILTDGRQVFSGALRYGQSTPFTIDTTDVLRLEVIFNSTTSGADGQLALGDTRVIGSPDQITELDAE